MNETTATEKPRRCSPSAGGALLGAIETAKAYAVGDGPITVVTLRMDEALALVRLSKEAASIIRGEAAALRECHTVAGEWDGTEPDAQDAYEHMLDVAERLAPNDEAQRRAHDEA